MNTDHLAFGPWTTTLHHSSRLELSAFWRRRLDRLGSLATRRPRMSWRTGLTLFLLAGALLVVPRLRLDASARAEEQTAPPAVATGAAAKDGEFVATFSNGVKVELIGLSMNPSKDQRWWAPDGAPLGQAPYSRVPAIAHPSEGGLAREICWRWSNTPHDPDFESDWMTEPHYDSAGGGLAFDASGKQVEGITAWAVGIPGSPDACTVRFKASIRATTWSTVTSNSGHDPGAMASTIDGVKQGMIFAESIAAGSDTTITVSHQIPGKAVRLVAVDKANRVHVASSSPGASALDFAQETYRFADIHPDQIERFDLQSQKREYETIEFRNVSLHPDKRSKLDIVHLASKSEQDETRSKETGAVNPASEHATSLESAEAPQVQGAEARNQRLLNLWGTLTSEDGYRLEKDQPLKRIPPPFSKARNEFLALCKSAEGSVPAELPSQPSFMIVRWDNDRVRPQCTFGSEPTLEAVLNALFNLKLQDVNADLTMLTMELPGDWIASWKWGPDHVTNADEIAALERILRDEMKLPVHLAWRDELRTVYVAKGKYKYAPIAGPDDNQIADHFLIPLCRTNTVVSVDSYREFLHSIGEVILTPIVDEADSSAKVEGFFWRFQGETAKNLLAPFDDTQVNELLASISKQTGLTFSKETRPVKTLFIERDAGR